MTNLERLERVRIGGSILGEILIGFDNGRDQFTSSRPLSDDEIKNVLCLSIEYLHDRGITELDAGTRGKYLFKREADYL